MAQQEKNLRERRMQKLLREALIELREERGFEALKSKHLDCVWIFEGWEGIQAQHEGLKLNVFPIINYGLPDYDTPTFITGPEQIKEEPDLLHRFMKATAQGYEDARTHPQESAQMLINETPKGTFPDPGLVFASQPYLSPRYADPGRRWSWQDAAAWHGYPEFMLKAGAILDATVKPVKSMDFDALYTNEFLS